MIMRWLLSFLVLAIVAVVRAASFTGSRLLVVLDEQAEREKYSVFLEDLAGECSSSPGRAIGSFRNNPEAFIMSHELQTQLLRLMAFKPRQLASWPYGSSERAPIATDPEIR